MGVAQDYLVPSGCGQTAAGQAQQPQPQSPRGSLVHVVCQVTGDVPAAVPWEMSSPEEIVGARREEELEAFCEGVQAGAWAQTLVGVCGDVRGGVSVEA